VVGRGRAPALCGRSAVFHDLVAKVETQLFRGCRYFGGAPFLFCVRRNITVYQVENIQHSGARREHQTNQLQFRGKKQRRLNRRSAPAVTVFRNSYVFRRLALKHELFSPKSRWLWEARKDRARCGSKAPSNLRAVRREARPMSPMTPTPYVISARVNEAPMPYH
jgi:hypothetical protein